MESKDKAKKIKTKVKDWFVITRIRVTNFMKEHKYTSALIGVFIMSCIFGIAAFAMDDPYSGKVSTSGSFLLKDQSTSTDKDIEAIKSFDTLVLDISYQLKLAEETNDTVVREKVIVEATFDESVDAEWIITSSDALYEIDKVNRKMTATIYNVKVGEVQKETLYLKVYNMPKDSNIKIDVKIKEGTAADFTVLESKTVKVDSTEVSLSPKIISGTAYKNSDITNGRFAPFGVLVGFDKSKLSNGSLKGLYFNPNLNLSVEASQSIGTGASTQIDLEGKEKYFGLYDSSMNLFNAPHFKDNNTSNSVYDSGKIELGTTTGDSAEGTETSSPEIYLIGDKTINLTVGDKYIEYGIATSKDGAAICKTSGTDCKRTIKDDKNTVITTEPMKEGTYKVTYVYNDVTITRTVVIKANDNKEETIDGKTYQLKGSSTVTLMVGDTYKEAGITGLTTIKSAITNAKGDVVDEKAMTETAGDYTVTYTITDTATMTRKVTVKAKTTTKAPIVKAKSVIMGPAASLPTPKVNIDGTEKECTAANKCSVKYYDSANKEVTPNSNAAGNYTVKYIVTSSPFEVVVTSILSIKKSYQLQIKGIKSDGKFYTDGNFIALGSYLVTAKSERPAGETKDISVKLKVGDVVSSPVINKNVSEGTKTTALDFYSDKNNNMTKLTEGNNFVAYGEDVILKSEFSYSADADESMPSVRVRVPITKNEEATDEVPFEMIEYFKNAGEGETVYYINDELKDKIKVKYHACVLENGINNCKENTGKDYDNYLDFIDEKEKTENYYIAYVEYSLKDIKPGTKVDFRLRLRKTTEGHARPKTLKSHVYTSDADNSEILSAQATISVKAFKAKSRVLVNDYEYDTIIDGTTTNKVTWTIYPSVEYPAGLVNEGIAGINELDSFVVTITLPNGINYVKNENYMQPLRDGNTLYYTIKGKKVNEWVDPIQLDTNFDIGIKSGTKLAVNVETSAETRGYLVNPFDSSTTTRSVTYQNTEVISYGQYTDRATISKASNGIFNKNQEIFSVSTKLYNNGTTVQNNLDIVTLLPYNDVSNEKENFTGAYKLENIPEGALCTTALPSEITNSDNLIAADKIEWKDCNEYENSGYVGVTAIRRNGKSLDVGKTYEDKITIVPTNNKPGDTYEVNAYLIMDGTDKRVVKNIKPIKVSVISKKITGNVWEDFDADGIMQPDEKKVAGVTMKLYKSDTDELVTTAVSDAKGNYELVGLEEGKYYVVAEYNSAKYGLSPYQASYDKSISSSFTVSKDDAPVVNPNNSLVPKTLEEEEELPPENPDEIPGDGDTDELPGDGDGEEKPEEPEIPVAIVKTEEIEITSDTTTISNINLGLALRKVYTVKLNKYITRTITTNRLGVKDTKEFGNVQLAKLDVKDFSNLNVKVVYTLELENTGYYPGYIYRVKDYIPEGMKFNPEYEENKDWVVNGDYVENNSLADTLVYGGEKRYLTIAYDIDRKEAGSFINYASVDDDDLQILLVSEENAKGGK